MSDISKRYQYTLWTGMYLEQEAEVLGSVRARAARPVKVVRGRAGAMLRGKVRTCASSRQQTPPERRKLQEQSHCPS